MKTTITAFKKVTCHKCGGDGHLPHYQHNKAGECFACNGTGTRISRDTFEREMTDAEVMVAFEVAGFSIMPQEFEPSGDWLADLFAGTPTKEVIDGARLMLSAA